MAIWDKYLKDRRDTKQFAEELKETYGFKNVDLSHLKHFSNLPVNVVKEHVTNSLDAFARECNISRKDIGMNGTFNLMLGFNEKHPPKVDGEEIHAGFDHINGTIIIKDMQYGSFMHEWLHGIDRTLGNIERGYDHDHSAVVEKDSPHYFKRELSLFSFNEDNIKFPDNYKEASEKGDVIWTAENIKHTGYMTNPTEMLARAFSTFVNEFLPELSDSFLASKNNNTLEQLQHSVPSTIPVGTERMQLLEVVSDMIDKLKDLDLLHDCELDNVPETSLKDRINARKEYYTEEEKSDAEYKAMQEQEKANKQQSLNSVVNDAEEKKSIVNNKDENSQNIDMDKEQDR